MNKFILIFSVVILFIGCINEEQHLSKVSCSADLVNLQDLYENAGVIHNQGLDFTYEKISTLNISNDTIPADSIIAFTNEFVNQFRDSNSNLCLAEKNIANAIIEQNLSPKDVILTVFNYEISLELEIVVDDLKTLYLANWNSRDLNQLIQSFAFNRVDLISDCVERTAFISMASVLVYSSDYWQNNYTKWESLNSNLRNSRTSPEEAMKDAALSDAVGGLTGAISGGIAGATAGTAVFPGIGTVVGGAGCVIVGMIGGAIGSSASSAAFSIFKWVIGW